MRSVSDPLTWIPVKRLTASDGAAFDEFGGSVALDGDTLLVGATGADVDGESNQGAVYLFQRDHGGPDGWGEVAKLTSPEGGAFDNFGDALALQGDELFVGAKDADVNGGSGRGAVFVFRQNAGDWVVVNQLADPEGRTNDSFGAAVAVAGDWLVAGAERADVSGLYENDGAALLFQKDAGSGNWLFFKRLSAADADGADRFGASVATDGERVLVGAPAAERNGEFTVGKAYLFESGQGGADSWGQVKMLVAGDGGAYDSFGSSVAVGADSSGGIAYVGASAADVTLADEGAVYLFAQDMGGPGNWGEASKISAGDGEAGDQFARDLALDAGALLVGANNANNGGAAYLYTPLAPSASSTVFLPLMRGRALPITGVLVDGGVVTGSDGVQLGAAPGALDRELPVSLLDGTAPVEPIPANATRVGDYYLLAASRDVVQPLATPFILALPVPPTADTGRLAAALHAPLADVQDLDRDSGNYWSLLPGVYDPAARQLLVQIPSLSPDGNSVALVEHPDMVTPVKGSHMRLPSNPAGKFVVLCLHTGCSDGLKEEVAQELLNNYVDLTGNLGYPEPRIQGTSSDISLNPPSVGQPSDHYYVSVLRTTNPACLDQNNNPVYGAYDKRYGELFICVLPGSVLLGSIERDTLRHEYFHALQYAYDNVLADWVAGGRDELWIIEGMATAVMRSGADWERSDEYNIRPVDKGLRDNTDWLEYETQDFWVYYGDNMTVGGVEQFKSILSAGATYDAFPNTVFGFAYTLWVRNQAIEKHDDMDGWLVGPPCQLEEGTVSDLLVYDLSMPNPNGYYSGATDILNTSVVELEFPAVWHGVPTTILVSPLRPGDTFPGWFEWKIYRTPVTNCTSTPENTPREYTISPDERYFIVMTNWATERSFGWKILAE